MFFKQNPLLTIIFYGESLLIAICFISIQCLWATRGWLLNRQGKVTSCSCHFNIRWVLFMSCRSTSMVSTWLVVSILVHCQNLNPTDPELMPWATPAFSLLWKGSTGLRPEENLSGGGLCLSSIEQFCRPPVPSHQPAAGDPLSGPRGAGLPGGGGGPPGGLAGPPAESLAAGRRAAQGAPVLRRAPAAPQRHPLQRPQQAGGPGHRAPATGSFFKISYPIIIHG